MLKSYEYTAHMYSKMTMQKDVYRDREQEIAKRFCDIHIPQKEVNIVCPICQRKQGRFLYEKWNVYYMHCEQCGSIYAGNGFEYIEDYRKLDELLQLRLSSEYQDAITSKRRERWSEFLDWLSVRCFRFMKKNKSLSIIDIGNRYEGYSEVITESDLCGEYELVDSILNTKKGCKKIGSADLVFYFDQMQNDCHFDESIEMAKSRLADDGLLVIETRAGSGFDILVLQENNKNIYPYEHMILPSIDGLITFLKNKGFDILEVTTPGIMDIKYVMDGREFLDDKNIFIKKLIDSNDSTLQEFQRFLQKNGMSSFVRVIAKKGKKR